MSVAELQAMREYAVKRLRTGKVLKKQSLL